MIPRFISEIVQNTAIATIECKQETVPNILNGSIFNDLERPLTKISRSRHYLTPHAIYRHIVTMQYE